MNSGPLRFFSGKSALLDGEGVRDMMRSWNGREWACALRLVFCVSVAFFLTGCGEITLYSGLKEKDANDMLAILSAHGIDVSKVSGADNTVTLTVQKNDFAEAVDILSRRGLPRETFSSISDLFKQTGMVSSPSEDKMRYIFAMAQSISETLTQIDGVISARVQIVPPDNNPMSDISYPSSASVFIKYNPRTNLDDLRPQVKQLVVNSIQGLTYEKVSLILMPEEDLEPISTVKPTKATSVWPNTSIIVLDTMAALSLIMAVLFYFKPSWSAAPAKKVAA